MRSSCEPAEAGEDPVEAAGRWGWAWEFADRRVGSVPARPAEEVHTQWDWDWEFAGDEVGSAA